MYILHADRQVVTTIMICRKAHREFYSRRNIFRFSQNVFLPIHIQLSFLPHYFFYHPQNLNSLASITHQAKLQHKNQFQHSSLPFFLTSPTSHSRYHLSLLISTLSHILFPSFLLNTDTEPKTKHHHISKSLFLSLCPSETKKNPHSPTTPSPGKLVPTSTSLICTAHLFLHLAKNPESLN